MTKRTAIFISHANPEDNVFTTWLGAKLSAAGFEVWADVLRLIGGQDWQRQLEDALRNRAFKVLMVGTERGVAKQGVRNEIQIASDIAKKISDSEFIIPLKLETFDAPFLIAHAQYIDFSQGWAAGLSELLDALDTYGVPKTSSESTDLWRAVQLINGKNPVRVEEQLISNWLKFQSIPGEVRYYEFKTGISDSYKEQAINSLKIPAVAQARGFITFADLLSVQEELGVSSPVTLKGSIWTSDFLSGGWFDLKLSSQIARNCVSNLLRQAIEALFRERGLSAYEMSSGKFCWFGSTDVAPPNQIKFAWNAKGISGRRQILGFSEKRKLYWHFGVSPQVTMWPEPHIKLRGGLVFSEDGKAPITNPKKMHKLRRSFAKSWRNPRWRDMLLSMLWWIAEGNDTIELVFGKEKAVLELPTITFISPVSMPLEGEVEDPEDQDDPDENEDVIGSDDFDEADETPEDIAA